MGTNGRRLVGRIVADMLLIAAAFLLPWWAALLPACVFFFVFDRFFELLLLALLMDLLYAVPLPRFGEFEFVFALGTALLYVVFTLIKKRIRF